MSKAKTLKPTVEFTLPQGSIFSALPASISPYIEITRMHIPPLNLVCYYPFVVGVVFAASVVTPTPTPLDVLQNLAAAYPVAFLCGAAGHTVDDTIDYDIDKRYTRCASRTIVRGAISRQAATVYSVLLLSLLQVAILKTYGSEYIGYGIFFTVLSCLYPLSKRCWNYPQVVIAVLHSIPIPWLAGALGVDLSGSELLAALTMAAVFGTNTMIFDIGYGLLDVQEDIKNRVGNIAARFRSNIKTLLAVLTTAHILLLVITGYVVDFGWVYYTGFVAKLFMLVYLITNLEPSSAQIILTLVGEYVYRYRSELYL